MECGGGATPLRTQIEPGGCRKAARRQRSCAGREAGTAEPGENPDFALRGEAERAAQLR